MFKVSQANQIHLRFIQMSSAYGAVSAKTPYASEKQSGFGSRSEEDLGPWRHLGLFAADLIGSEVE